MNIQQKAPVICVTTANNPGVYMVACFVDFSNDHYLGLVIKPSVFLTPFTKYRASDIIIWSKSFPWAKEYASYHPKITRFHAEVIH